MSEDIPSFDGALDGLRFYEAYLMACMLGES